jgi:hypothetical protein
MWDKAEIFTKIKNAYEDTGIGGERLGEVGNEDEVEKESGGNF